MYTEASNRVLNDYAEIVSPKLRPGSYCVKFAYHMRGSSMGRLEVFFMESSSKVRLLTWRESGDHGDLWKLASYDFASPRNNRAIQFMFKSVIGTGYSSDIAIDNINILEGRCSGSPIQTTTLRTSKNVKTNPPKTTTAIRTTPSKTTKPRTTTRTTTTSAITNSKTTTSITTTSHTTPTKTTKPKTATPTVTTSATTPTSAIPKTTTQITLSTFPNSEGRYL